MTGIARRTAMFAFLTLFECDIDTINRFFLYFCSHFELLVDADARWGWTALIASALDAAIHRRHQKIIIIICVFVVDS